MSHTHRHCKQAYTCALFTHTHGGREVDRKGIPDTQKYKMTSIKDILSSILFAWFMT